MVTFIPLKFCLEPGDNWSRSWLVYCEIGHKVICQRGASQQYLATYVSIFQLLFHPLKLK